MLVTLDFETYFDTKVTLTKMTTMEYVKHPMFKVWGVGIKIDNQATEWFGEDETEEALNDINWSKAHLLCHNTPFDGYILTQLYDLVPPYYLDTAAMARGRWPGESASLKDVAVRCFPDDNNMRKGEELITAKGTYDLPPAIEDALAGYCIQDVDLTYAIYQQLLPEYPQTELDIIDLTCRMFCEPKMRINVEKLEQFVNAERCASEKAIDDSGIDRKVLSSNQQFAEWAVSQGLTVPTKTSPSTGEKIPAFGKNDAAYKQWQQQHPEWQHVFAAREAVKSRINETRAQRFIDCAKAGGHYQHPCVITPLTPVDLAVPKRLISKTYRARANFVKPLKHRPAASFTSPISATSSLECWHGLPNKMSYCKCTETMSMSTAALRPRSMDGRSPKLTKRSDLSARPQY